VHIPKSLRLVILINGDLSRENRSKLLEFLVKLEMRPVELEEPLDEEQLLAFLVHMLLLLRHDHVLE
jgi:hypothetical protein